LAKPVAIHVSPLASEIETGVALKRQKTDDGAMNPQQMELYTATFMQSYYDALQKMQEQQIQLALSE
jgi:hypothetical protein